MEYGDDTIGVVSGRVVRSAARKMKVDRSMKIAVLGAAGLLGSTLTPYLKACGHEVITHSRHGDTQFQADLTNSAATYDLLQKIAPESIVNLIGLTNVDRCEKEPNEAYLANVRTIENISSWVRNTAVPCHLVHISTDQIYDSLTVHAEDQVRLTNYYAFSKYAGELAAMGISATILRTNFIGRSRCVKRTGLTDWLYRSLTEGTPIQVFDDVQFSPLSISTLVEMIELTLQKKPVGVFNLGSRDGMSKADFAFAFARKCGFSTETMTRTSTDTVVMLTAYRPKDMRMDCTKIEKALGVTLPSLINEIGRAVEDYCEKG
jgi:dTDP-4-dehydrorhamnose reductase